MSFVLGVVFGIAFGLAIIVAFVKSENARSKQRTDLASGIAAFARMTVDDSRKIFTPEQYPSWVFSQISKRYIVIQAASELVKSSVEPVLEQYRPVEYSLSGPFPNNASMLQNLTQLHLSYNSPNGTIPSLVFSLPLLYSLSLDHNRFSGLPDKFKTNPALEVLYLSHNQLSGSFPQSLSNLTNLSLLGLSSKNITIDAGIKITFPNLGDLRLSSCELKDFPHFLRNLKTLWSLDISSNKIRGQIPDWFSGMR